MRARSLSQCRSNRLNGIPDPRSLSAGYALYDETAGRFLSYKLKIVPIVPRGTIVAPGEKLREEVYGLDLKALLLPPLNL